MLVDDASDEETRQFLKNFVECTGARLVRHHERQGYTKAANAGIRASTAANILLLNSDTIVPRGAFDKLVQALERDPNLGIVGPLSNAASWQSVPSINGSASQTAINGIPPGMTIDDIDLFFERRWDGEIVRTPLVHGFCFCIKRTVVEMIGLLDEENFPRGYGEENDFCFRAADAGFDLGVLTNTYVYHAKSKSYRHDERARLMSNGAKALIRKATKSRIERAVETMQKNPALEAARGAIAPLFCRQSVSEQRTGRLFLLPSRRSDGLPAGSAYVRLLLPYRSEAVTKEWDVAELHTLSLPCLRATDTVIIQREACGIEFDALQAWIGRARDAGTRLVYDVDDDLLDAAALKERGFQGDAHDLAKARALARRRSRHSYGILAGACRKVHPH